MKRTMKGFTLVELIVVMATFSIIMFGALAMMDPVSRVFTKSYEQESKTASTDSIKRYLEGTLRYAETMKITDTEPTLNDLVKYVDTYYNGKVYIQNKSDLTALNMVTGTNFDEYYPKKITAVNASGTPTGWEDATRIGLANGKLYVMEIDNAAGGKISLTEYDYQAGDVRCEKVQASEGDVDYLDAEKTVKKGDDDLPSVVRQVGTKQENILNRAFYEKYNYTFSLGVYTMNGTRLVADADYYNSFSDTTAMQEFDISNFAIAITAYDKEVKETQADGTVATVPAKKTVTSGTDTHYEYSADSSPYIMNASLSLPNIAKGYLRTRVYKFKYTAWDKDKAGTWKSERIRLKDAADVSTENYDFESVKPRAAGTEKLFDDSEIADNDKGGFTNSGSTLIPSTGELDKIYIIYSYCGEDIVK